MITITYSKLVKTLVSKFVAYMGAFSLVILSLPLHGVARENDRRIHDCIDLLAVMPAMKHHGMR